MNASEMIYVGVDVSKDTLECGRSVDKATRQFRNDEAGFAQLIAHLKAPLGGSIGLVLMEATGGFERAVATALTAADIPLVIINPRQAHDFGKAMGVFE